MSLDDRLKDPEIGPRLIRLVELLWPETITDAPVRRCSRTVPPNYRGVTYGGASYTLDDFEFSEIRHIVGSERVRLELSFQNQEDPLTGLKKPWTTFVGTRDLNGATVNLRIVEESLIADPASEIPELRWTVSGYGIRGGRLRLGLGSPFDALMLETPGVPLASRTCLWAMLGLYKRHPCNSASSLATCDGSLGECGKRFPAGAVLPFGPSFPLYAPATRRRRG